MLCSLLYSFIDTNTTFIISYFFFITWFIHIYFGKKFELCELCKEMKNPNFIGVCKFVQIRKRVCYLWTIIQNDSYPPNNHLMTIANCRVFFFFGKIQNWIILCIKWWLPFNKNMMHIETITRKTSDEYFSYCNHLNTELNIHLLLLQGFKAIHGIICVNFEWMWNLCVCWLVKVTFIL